MPRSGKTGSFARVKASGFATAALLSIAGPATAGPCILPVSGEEPLSEAEAKQPYRIAYDPLTLPGYSGLLLRPKNRPDDSHFYEIDGQTYRQIATPAPGSTYLDSEILPVRGGGAFLFGWEGRTLWHLPHDAQSWQDVAPGRQWWGFAHDEGARDLYVSFGPQAPIQVWNGTSFVPAGAMPTVFLDATSPISADALPAAILTLPKAGGTFAIAREMRNEDWRSLWFRPFGGDWSLVADKPALDAMAPGLRYPGPFLDADVSDDGQTVRLFAGHPREASVLLRKTPNSWALESAAPYQSWLTHHPSGIRLAWIGEPRQDLTESVLFFFSRTVDPEPPGIHALDQGTLAPRPLSDIAPAESVTGSSVFYLSSIVRIPGLDPLLVRAADGWHSFDGTSLSALATLRAERVGDLASIKRVGPLILVQSNMGIFTLDDTLTAQPVASFPVTEPWPSSVDIAYLDAPGLFVVVEQRSRTLHVSKDLETFQPVASPAPITKLAAPLPDRPGLLLVGNDGLYVFESDCPRKGD